MVVQIENAEKINSSIESVRYKKWNVYSKAPFEGPCPDHRISR